MVWWHGKMYLYERRVDAPQPRAGDGTGSSVGVNTGVDTAVNTRDSGPGLLKVKTAGRTQPSVILDNAAEGCFAAWSSEPP